MSLSQMLECKYMRMEIAFQHLSTATLLETSQVNLLPQVKKQRQTWLLFVANIFMCQHFKPPS